MFTDFKPKFTKRFAKLTEVAVTGIKQYIKEVKEGSFPDDDHSYTVKEDEYEKFANMVASAGRFERTDTWRPLREEDRSARRQPAKRRRR